MPPAAPNFVTYPRVRRVQMLTLALRSVRRPSIVCLFKKSLDRQIYRRCHLLIRDLNLHEINPRLLGTKSQLC